MTAHCHPANAVRRSVAFSVRTIEHGTLIDDDTARFVAERGRTLCQRYPPSSPSPNRVARWAFPLKARKMDFAARSAIGGLDAMRRAGVKVCYGTDLLGSTYVQQCREFTLRSEVFTPLELLRQATSIPAEMMMMEGLIGCVALARMQTCWWWRAIR